MRRATSYKDSLCVCYKLQTSYNVLFVETPHEQKATVKHCNLYATRKGPTGKHCNLPSGSCTRKSNIFSTRWASSCKDSLCVPLAQETTYNVSFVEMRHEQNATIKHFNLYINRRSPQGNIVRHFGVYRRTATCECCTRRLPTIGCGQPAI